LGGSERGRQQNGSNGEKLAGHAIAYDEILTR
jgi:hypothetical protein